MNPSPVPAAWRRWSLPLLFWGPLALVLGGSYLYLACVHGTANLFSTVVHENGRYTLTQTIFYFRHFVREILPATFIAAAVVIAFHFQSPDFSATLAPRAQLLRLRRWFGWGALLFLAFTVAMALQQQGVQNTLVDLFQARTRDDRAEYGTHWQYHFLHLLDALLFSFGVVWLVRGLAGNTATHIKPRALRGLTLWIAAFGLLTLIFAPSLRPFTDPLYLAHQLREIATHRLLCVPAIVGLLYGLERQALASPGWGTFDGQRCLRGLLVGTVATGIPLWIWWQLKHVNVLSLAQQQSSLATLYAAHNFEHCLDVIYTLLLAGWLYLRLLLAPSPGANPTAPA